LPDYSTPYQPQQPAVQQQPERDPNIVALEGHVKTMHEQHMTAQAQYNQYPLPNNKITVLKAAIAYYQAAELLAKTMLEAEEGPANGTA